MHNAEVESGFPSVRTFQIFSYRQIWMKSGIKYSQKIDGRIWFVSYQLNIDHTLYEDQIDFH
jgi:hypothetical protein